MEPKTRTSRATAELFEEAGSCAVTPELTEGPYYFDVDSIRSDITEDREGTPLRLALRVRDAGSCEPIENAVVDVWHCDAGGLYSGFESASTGGPGRRRRATDEETYLRGAQVTNEDGIAQFQHHLPGLVPRPHGAHPRQGAPRPDHRADRRSCSSTTPSRTTVYARGAVREDRARDVFNDARRHLRRGGLLTLREEGDGVLGLLNLDVRRS